MSSRYCHSPDITYRYKINVLADESIVYRTEKECLEDGGILPPSVAVARADEDPEARDQKAFDKKWDKGTEKLYGINWGLGFGFASFSQDSINRVVIDNGVVRVEENSINKAIAMLENRYFWR